MTNIHVALRPVAALMTLLIATFVLLRSSPLSDVTVIIPSVNASVCHNMPHYLSLVGAVVLVHGPNSPSCQGAVNLNASDNAIGAANRFLGVNHVSTPLTLSLDNDIMPHRWSLRWMRAELLKNAHGHVGTFVRRCDSTGYWENSDDAVGHKPIVLTGLSLHYTAEMQAIVKTYYAAYADTLAKMNGNGEDIVFNRYSKGRPSALHHLRHYFVYRHIQRRETVKYTQYHAQSNHILWRSSLCMMQGVSSL